MAKIVLMSVPLLELKCPVTGPYILKSCLKEKDISCKVYDFNVWLWHEVGNVAPELWDTNGNVFGIEEKFNEYYDIIYPVVQKYVFHVLLNDDPDWIGITQFAWTSGLISKMIVQEFKDQGFTGKVVFGGPNCMEWDENHHMWGVGDHVIYGEGEDSLIQLIKGNTNYPGIDNKMFKQIQDLDAYPYPDYSDVEWYKYPVMFNDLHNKEAWRNEKDKLKQLFITSSRGCVRNCTFCDIHAMAPKFKYRSGKCVAEEVLYHNQKWGITFFNFTDSLINGATKVFEDFLDSIIEYKEKGLIPEEVEFWGQAIARPEKQSPERVFEKMYRAGVRSISIGIESGSEAVREHMGKKFNNKDLDFTVEMCHKYGVSISCLMLVGYPTETEKDFQDTLDFFTRHKDKKGKGLKSVAIGPTLVILPYSPLAKQINVLGITSDINGDWIMDTNNLETRMDRWLRLRQHLVDLGFKVFPDRHSTQIKEYKDKLTLIRKNKLKPMVKSYTEKWGYKNVLLHKAG